MNLHIDFQWRLQNRAGKGQLVYGVCDTGRPKLIHQIMTENETNVDSRKPLTNGFTGANLLYSPTYDPSSVIVHLELIFQMKACNGIGLRASGVCRESFDLMIHRFDDLKRQNDYQVNAFCTRHFTK